MKRSNKNKKMIVVVGIILILTSILLIINLFIPKINIELNEEPIITVEVGKEYTPLEAKAYIQNIFGKEEIKVKTSGIVDVTKIGKYIITYEAKGHNMTQSKIKVINVIDDIEPVIKVDGAIKACQNNRIVDINAVATDNYDGDITNKIKFKILNDDVYLSVTDSSNNKKIVKSTMEYIDQEKPILELNDSATIYLNMGSTYNEPGARATDSCDGDLTKDIKISGLVDTKKEGNYTITYEVKDKDGNVTTKKRQVMVIANKTSSLPNVTNGTIYLTFDDGPGQYTERYLEILKKYNIKATFFVTGQFPKYFDLIKREYEEGHTVGIHTYSHKWNIYESVETYLADFNKIENVIYEKTNIHPVYFRFPGGSSNTISRRYCDKIMTNLAKIMTDKGYTYFDWTFDSGDTIKGKNTKEEIIKTVKSYLHGNGEYIILMHDLKKSSLEALPEIITYAKERGYTFKPITKATTVKHFKIAN